LQAGSPDPAVLVRIGQIQVLGILAIRGPGGSEGQGRFQPGAPGGEAQEDEAEESFQTGTIEIRFGKVGRRHCLPGGVPEALFEGGVVGVFFGWGDPVHGLAGRVFQTVSVAKWKR